MGQSRGAQSGEADRHAVWLDMQGLEPKLSPLDPMAILDEIQRLVPGYDVSRVNLLAGNERAYVARPTADPGAAQMPESIVSSNDALFTSGTLGRYSRTLKSVMESHEVKARRSRGRLIISCQLELLARAVKKHCRSTKA